jgi:predicted PolB exonuclease-like 3'-5' exonuclease
VEIVKAVGVFEKYKAGKLNEVAEYCRKDVEATRQVYKRMTFQ